MRSPVPGEGRDRLPRRTQLDGCAVLGGVGGGGSGGWSVVILNLQQCLSVLFGDFTPVNLTLKCRLREGGKGVHLAFWGCQEGEMEGGEGTRLVLSCGT